MNLTVNGAPYEPDDAPTIRDVVERVAPRRGERGTAVAINGEVVPRTMWDETKLSDGDRVEVLHAIGGG